MHSLLVVLVQIRQLMPLIAREAAILQVSTLLQHQDVAFVWSPDLGLLHSVFLSAGMVVDCPVASVLRGRIDVTRRNAMDADQQERSENKHYCNFKFWTSKLRGKG